MKRPFAAAAVWIAFLLSSSSGTAQPKDDERPPVSLPANGSELFRGLLSFHKIEPLKAGELRNADYSKLIVVVMGLPTRNDPKLDLSFHVRETLQAGGSVLLAADGSGPLASYFPRRQSSLALTGETVFEPDESHALVENGWCPFARPTTPSPLDLLLWERQKQSPGPEWTLFAGLNRIATNVPHALRLPSRPTRYDRYALARFPSGSLVGGPAGDRLASDRALAVGSSGVEPNEEPFRCLVVSDPSIFTNQMMAVNLDNTGPGTDNLAFANNVAQFLKANGDRTKCLFVENGRMIEKFDDVQFAASPLPDMPPLPIPPLPSPLDPGVQSKLTDFVNNSVDRWQTKDGPNGTVVGRPARDQRVTGVLAFLAVLATAVIVLLKMRALRWSSYKGDVLPVPTDTGRVVSSGPPGTVARRKEELLQGGNYTGPVSEYLKEFFVGRGYVVPTGEIPKKLPKVTITGGDSGTLRSQLKALWEVAFDPKSKPVGFTRWKELEPMIAAVKRAAEADRWRFAPEGRS